MSWTRSAFEKTNRQRSEGEGKKVVGLRSGGGGTFTRGSGDDKCAEGVLLAGQTASEGSALFIVTIDYASVRFIVY